jgi:hypothetical protein
MVSPMTPYGCPPDKYHCLLDEQPYYLVPPRLVRPDEGNRWIVNPLCLFSWREPSEREMVSARLPEQSFLPWDWLVWVPDAATGAVWPYWLGSDYMAWIKHLVPGQPLSVDLPPHIVWVLANADILVASDHQERRRGEWLHYRTFRAADFRTGFVVVPNLIPPFHIGAMRRYFRFKVRAGCFELGDGQVSRRYAAHNEPIARYVHDQLAGAMGEIAGASIKPSYAYFVAYQGGATLDRHTDREQCEYSITLLTDFTPEPMEQAPWPIMLDTWRGTVGIWQYLGEALLYRGRELAHHRGRLETGSSSTSLLLHYVRSSFAGQLS